MLLVLYLHDDNLGCRDDAEHRAGTDTVFPRIKATFN